MSSNLPNHPLYAQLCEKAKRELPKVGFALFKENEGNISFNSNLQMTILIKHEGYDMPSVYFGNENNPEICASWGPLEYFLNRDAPIYRKYKELNTFYDLEFELDLILKYQNEILSIINSPETYNLWIENVDITDIFDKLNDWKTNVNNN